MSDTVGGIRDFCEVVDAEAADERDQQKDGNTRIRDSGHRSEMPNFLDYFNWPEFSSTGQLVKASFGCRFRLCAITA
jgi:hypothetical protein